MLATGLRMPQHTSTTAKRSARCQVALESRIRSQESHGSDSSDDKGNGKGMKPLPVRLRRGLRPRVQRHDFVGWAIATLVGLRRNCVPLQFVRTPSAWNMRAAAGTIQRPLLSNVFCQGTQERPVPVRAGAHQITHPAFWALDAMANSGGHGYPFCSHSLSKFMVMEWTLADLNPTN
jgi:hypothetical protein